MFSWSLEAKASLGLSLIMWPHFIATAAKMSFFGGVYSTTDSFFPLSFCITFLSSRKPLSLGNTSWALVILWISPYRHHLRVYTQSGHEGLLYHRFILILYLITIIYYHNTYCHNFLFTVLCLSSFSLSFPCAILPTIWWCQLPSEH